MRNQFEAEHWREKTNVALREKRLKEKWRRELSFFERFVEWLATKIPHQNHPTK